MQGTDAPTFPLPTVADSGRPSPTPDGLIAKICTGGKNGAGTGAGKQNSHSTFK